MGAGEANEVVTNGGSGTRAVGNPSGSGTRADAGAAVRSCPGAGIDAYGESTSVGAAGADVDDEVRSAVDKTGPESDEIRSAALSDRAWTEGCVVVGDGRAKGTTPAFARSGDSV